jgi:hypothetical protein
MTKRGRKMHKKGKILSKKLLLFTLAFVIVIGQFVYMGPIQTAEAVSGEPELFITGTGLKQDVKIGASDWNRYSCQERYYSSNNSFNYHKITKTKGYDLFDIIGKDNLKTDEDYPVKFICSDGFDFTKNISTLKNAYYYPDFTEEKKETVAPILSFYKKELISVAKEDLTSPISWEDQALTEEDKDGKAPRLIFGQIDIDDMNQSKWGQKIVKIIVGEERPVEEPVITIEGDGVRQKTSLTLSDLKGMPEAYQIDEVYPYNTKGGLKTVSVKGVNLGYLLNEVVGITDPTSDVQFICSDGYAVAPQKQSDIADLELGYVLAYEVDGQEINDDAGKAKLRIYRKQKTPDEFETVFKSICGIQIGKGKGIDFENSPYKHINKEGAPYNVDSLTGATLTIEGPGVESYRAISLRQIEEENDGLVRGTYSEVMPDGEKQNTYEGISVAYLLDHFVNLKENVGKIIFKDKSRKKIAEYTLDEIRKTDYLNNTTGENNLQIMVAYGINEVPLVFTNTDVGYMPEKYNDNGCFKLAVGQKTESDPSVEFSNIAYIYVEESDAPGIYEHSQAPYNDPKFTNYLLTLTGSGLGKEINYTVADIEKMEELQIEKEYSLSNSEYFWYYNTYKGVKLWDLLLKSGLDPDIDENTKVQMIAADNYNFEPMTIKDIKEDALYGYYEKDSNDLGDGKFDGSSVQPLDTGYPVLVAYGFNSYPYVVHPSDPGYNAGLRNDGGPLRVIFGKKSYDHTNGSKQVQFIKKIIIGDEKNYTTHSYAPYDTLANDSIHIGIKDDNGALIKEEDLTVSDIEDMIYGEAVSSSEANKAKVKASYFIKMYQDQKISDLYEGIGLWYLLSEKIGLPGTMGTVTFEDYNGNTQTVSLEDIKKADYFNEATGVNDLKPVLAYAKNGYPLVQSKKDPGDVEHNNGGPLAIVFGQSEEGTPGITLNNVQKITVAIQKDQWAHIDEPYDTYQNNTLRIHGDGARKEKTLTVSELEALQNYILTDTYCIAKSEDTKNEETYRGIDIYEYLRREIGFQASATEVTFIASDGYAKTFTLDEMVKRDYVNEIDGANDLKMILAYGKNEKPLVESKESEGYDSAIANHGGPLKLVVGQMQAGDFNNGKCVSNITEIVIKASGGISWKHDHGAYKEYGENPVLRVTGSQVKEPRTFTLNELEALTEQIVRNTYTGDGTAEYEGVILWKLIKDIVGLKEDVDIPSIRVFSGPGYNQILQNMDQVINGVKNSQGEYKDVILGYAKDGYPLVPKADSIGYENNNQFGPLRLIIEENKSMWIKCTDCIVVGSGDYEEPKAEDVKDGNEEDNNDENDLVKWALYKNNDDSGLPQASIRCITPDHHGGIWVGTYGAGAVYKDADGNWMLYTKENSDLQDNTIYDIAVDEKNGIWFTVGGPESAKGVAYKEGEHWTVYNTSNSDLPSDFVQKIALDDQGGTWFGTAAGAAYRDKDGIWTVYDKKDGFPANSITQITLDQQGGVWFGFYPDTIGENAYHGGYAYLDAEGKITPYEEPSDTTFYGNWVRSIAIDKDGSVWVCCSGSYEGKNAKIHHIKDGQKTVYDVSELYPSITDGDDIRLLATGDDGLWLGTRKSGVLYRNSEGQITRKYNSANGWPSPQWDNIYYLNTDKDGNVLVGSNGGIGYGVLNQEQEDDHGSGGGGSSGGSEEKPKDTVLTIEGSGVDKDYYFTLKQLQNETEGRVHENYFSLNNYGTRKYFEFEGISLKYILDKMVDLNSSAESVTIKATDGYYREYNLSDVKKNYIDENDSKVKLPMILAWKEEGSNLRGKYPLKLVMGQAKEGDINKENWVRNVEVIEINKGKVHSGSGSSGSYNSGTGSSKEDSKKEIDMSKYIENEIIRNDGRKIEQITFNRKADDFLKDVEMGSNIVLTAQKENEGVEVVLSGKNLQTIQKRKLDINIKNAVGNYYLPQDVLKTEEIVKQIKANLEDLSVKIKISKVLPEKEKMLNNALKQGQKILADPVEFKIEWSAKDKSIEDRSFYNQYVKREIPVKDIVNERNATGVVWNEEKNRFTFVPTAFKKGKEDLYATIFNRTNSIYTVLETEKTFEDIQNHWAKEDIETLASKLIIAGKNETHFAPKDSITRAEFATLLMRGLALNENQLSKEQFKDMTGEEWFAHSVAAAVEAGIVNGYDDHTFRPNHKITRQEMAVMLSRALKVAEKEEKIKDNDMQKLLNKFYDHADIAAWAKEGVAIAANAQIVNGTDDHMFLPQDNADRAQSAKMLKNFLMYIGFINK